MNVPSVLFFEGGHVILRPTDTRFPNIEHDINSSHRVVPMVYYGDYNIEFSGNWYRPKVTRKTVSATIEELGLDFEYKSIIDSNGENRTETVWSENPQIIIDGGEWIVTETISAEIISAVLQMKRMTSAQWRTSQYVPRQGEPVCEK